MTGSLSKSEKTSALSEEAEPPGTTAHSAPSGRVEEDAATVSRNTPRQRPADAAALRVPAARQAFYKRYFPLAGPTDWSNWRWQLRNRWRTAKQLSTALALSSAEKEALAPCPLGQGGKSLPVAITPYYASLLSPNDPEQPLRRTVVPVLDEFRQAAGETEDPLAEESDSVVPGVVHRYPDRALFLVSSACSVYCRYCTRSRLVTTRRHAGFAKDVWERGLAYIEANKQIRDVLLSGGDPLLLSNDEIEWLLLKLKRIKHVEFVRIGTKVPAVLPQRITPGLTKVLKRFHPLWVSIHFTHPDELTPECSQACERLADAGMPLGSQTVLLRGINDSADTMKKLFHGLLKIRVKPYYLYQCDPIIGSAHFRTPVRKGLEIIQSLRGYTTGYAVPHFVIDAPGGGGKIPLLPDYLVGQDGVDLVLRNYEGLLFRYPDVIDKKSP